MRGDWWSEENNGQRCDNLPCLHRLHPSCHSCWCCCHHFLFQDDKKTTINPVQIWYSNPLLLINFNFIAYKVCKVKLNSIKICIDLARLFKIRNNFASTRTWCTKSQMTMNKKVGDVLARWRTNYHHCLFNAILHTIWS